MPEIIKFTCPVCEEEFYDTNFHEGFAADSCKCGNLIVNIRDFSKPWKWCEKYLAVGYTKEKPTIDTMMIEEDED